MHDVALATASIADSQGTTADNNAEEVLMQIKTSKLFDRCAADRLDSSPSR
jgi:hypothetical protein